MIFSRQWYRLSEEAKNLFRWMTHFDPLKRCSAHEALSSDWISKHCKEIPESCDK